MKNLYTKRRLLILTAILIISNLLITGVTIFVLYNKSKPVLEANLIDIVERQKSLITTLQEQGKTELEIIGFLKAMQEKHANIGQLGEYAIGKPRGDSAIFLLGAIKEPIFYLNNIEKNGLPMGLALQKKEGFVIAHDYAGIHVFAAYTYIPTLKWGLVAKIPVSEVIQPYYNAIYITLIISIFLILLFVYIFSKISNPILNAILESEEKFRRAIQQAPFPIIIHAEDGEIISVSEGWTDNSGYSLADIPTIDSWTNLAYGQTKHIVIEEINSLYELKTRKDEGEYTICCKNGTIRIWDFSSTAIGKLEDGRRIVISMANDVTERKNNELLIKEKSDLIESQNEEFQQINEELVQTNEELILAIERAEKSDRLKTAFLQNMSHEIRTPMNAIIGFSELLPVNFDNKDKLEKFADIIRQRSADLLEIINEILDIAKIESGHSPINLEKCNLDSLFSELTFIFKENKQSLNKPDIKFKHEIDIEISTKIIIADSGKLKQILINLIGNAFKFTDKGSIKVGVKNHSTQLLEFYVSDTGIGIPVDKQDYVFERFAQLEQTPDHLYGGTGLGLSIVKGLVDLLGGKIWLESEIDKGTTIFFTIPYLFANEIQNDYVQYNDVTINRTFSQKTILIVEDDLSNAEYLKEVLSKLELNILHTIYGKEAVQIVKTNEVDIVLMDVRLPDINGYEATRQIKQFKPTQIIIAQTAYAASSDEQNSYDAGCNYFISKPINKNMLLSIIDKCLINS